MAAWTSRLSARGYACSPCKPPTQSSASLASRRFASSVAALPRRRCFPPRRSAPDCFATFPDFSAKSGGSNVGRSSFPALTSSAAAATPPWDAHHAPHASVASL